MWRCQSLIVSILILLQLVSTILGKEDDQDWKHKYLCTSQGNCLTLKNNTRQPTPEPRNRASVATEPLIVYESQNLCHLLCGKYGSLWPKPTGRTKLGNSVVSINPENILFSYNEVGLRAKEYLDEVTDLFVKNVLKDCFLDNGDCDLSSKTDCLVQILLTDDSCDNLTWTTDESYSLEISQSDVGISVEINAITIFGARHALETLSQLITNNNTGPRNIPVIINSAHIKDSPAYAHRGLLLDTARNFLNVKDIERTLDGMASTKLNVFHWHATDSQSFPLDLPLVPQMAKYGSYSVNYTYSIEDIKHVIDYAKIRGIRVIIEIDAPSHSGNGWQWGPEFGYGDLAVCIDKQPWRQFCVQPPCGQLNPVNANVIQILRLIYLNLIEVLPKGETLHMGGDEVFLACWNSTNEIITALEKRGLNREQKDFLLLWSEFQAAALHGWDTEVKRSEEAATPAKVILWSSQLTESETISNYLPADRYIIQTWVPTQSELPANLIAKGYSLIMSTKNAWYFDHGFWGPHPYYTWRHVYSNRILRNDHVLGGEACIWGELIDGNSLDERAWPRAAALGERLWADPNTTVLSAESRFYRNRERIVRKGIRAEAVAPKWCTKNEGLCS